MATYSCPKCQHFGITTKPSITDKPDAKESLTGKPDWRCNQCGWEGSSDDLCNRTR